MKIIEAMKKIKDLQRKAEDLRKKVAANCAHLDHDTPEYKDPDGTVAGWVQAHSDIVREIEKLRVAIQRTNIATEVEMYIGGQVVRKNIAAWIHRRRDLAKLDEAMQCQLTDRGLQEGFRQSSVGDAAPIEVKIVRHFDSKKRDELLDTYRSEPLLIDSTLEVVNATTDIVEG